MESTEFCLHHLGPLPVSLASQARYKHAGGQDDKAREAGAETTWMAWEQDRVSMNHRDQDRSHSRTGTPSWKPVHREGAGLGTAGDGRLHGAWAQPAFNRRGPSTSLHPVTLTS